MDQKPDAEPKVSPGAAASLTAPGSGLSFPQATSPSPAVKNGETPFGAALEPALRAACVDRLSAISWFRTDWQRGGALTGYASWRNGDGTDHPVVVKLPVPPAERQWLVRLNDHDDVIPRIHAHGESVGAYDIAWVVMERLPHGPLGQAWKGSEFDLVAQAIGRFYRAAKGVPLEGRPLTMDWDKVIKLGRENIRQHDVAHEQRWSQAMKKAKRRLDAWLREWDRRPIDGWCHGDLHLANAMSRHPAPQGPALLLDFAQTRIGHWIEDAVYFEHLFWARKQRLGDRKLCSLIAQERKKHALSVDADWPRFASIKRALLALSVPANLTLDGDRLHVEASLDILEAEVARG